VILIWICRTTFPPFCRLQHSRSKNTHHSNHHSGISPRK